MIKIIKRDGTEVKYDPNKIKEAIEKASPASGSASDITEKVIHSIELLLKDKNKLTVEEVQDKVISVLLELGQTEHAKAYIGYRAIRTHIRLVGVEGLINRMGEIVTHGDDENSNKQYTLPSVVRDTIAGEYFRDNLFKVLPKDIAEAHKNKILHWHDSDHDPKLSNCCIFNIKDMLDKGTRVTNADIQKPKSVEVAMNVAMQIMASISASQYGGVSLPEFNEVFAEYAKMNFIKHFRDYFEFEENTEVLEDSEIVTENEDLASRFPKVFKRAKEKTAKNIYDACQLFEYQTNSILGSASQTPFSTITFSIPTSWESAEIIKSYLNVRMRGLGERGIPAIFPKISMIVVNGYNCRENDPYFEILQLAGKCIAKTYYPDILNYTKEAYDSGRYYARMGCRSRVNHEYSDASGAPVRMGRFNGGVVTANLPHMALQAIKNATQNTLEEFFRLLKTELYPLMQKALVQRFEFVKKLKAKEAPILFQYGGIARLDPEETIEELLKTDQASFSYGFLGIDDCVRLLTADEENISTPEGRELGLHIMQTIRTQADNIKANTGLPVSLYGTPAEAGIHTLFQRDLELFGDIMPEWLKNREYYTNSFHFSSELPIEFFRKMEVESEFVHLANGGNISYVENSGKETNSEAIVELIQYANELGIQYFAINTITDVCYECGFTGEISYNENTAVYSCPHCGNTNGMNMKIQRRSCGYISNYNITHAKKGRMIEILRRFKHI